MSHDNPQIRRRRRIRGSGGLNKRLVRGRVRWVVSWREHGKRRQKVVDSQMAGLQLLQKVAPQWRDLWLAELRELLWAELRARIQWRENVIVGKVRMTVREAGHLGGTKGGPERAKRLTPERRREIASIAGRTRWELERQRQNA